MKKNPIIDIYLHHEHDYKSFFNENKLSNKLSMYIIDECKGFPYNCDLELHFKTDFELTSSEKIKIRSMIRSNFDGEVRENIIYMDKLFKKDILLFLFGCLFILIAVNIEKNSPVISEIILIIGWVGIWEVIYSVFFSDYKKRLEIKRYKQLSNSKITFSVNKM